MAKYSEAIRNMISEVINKEISIYLWRNLRGKTHRMCLHCGFIFEFRTRYHHFCSRKCYSKFHRIPGCIRRIINQRD